MLIFYTCTLSLFLCVAPTFSFEGIKSFLTWRLEIVYTWVCYYYYTPYIYVLTNHKVYCNLMNRINRLVFICVWWLFILLKKTLWLTEWIAQHLSVYCRLFSLIRNQADHSLIYVVTSGLKLTFEIVCNKFIFIIGK